MVIFFQLVCVEAVSDRTGGSSSTSSGWRQASTSTSLPARVCTGNRRRGQNRQTKNSTHPFSSPSRLLFPLPSPLAASFRSRSPHPLHSPQTLASQHPRSTPAPLRYAPIGIPSPNFTRFSAGFFLIFPCFSSWGGGGVEQAGGPAGCSSPGTRRRGSGWTWAAGATRSATARCCSSRRARSDDADSRCACRTHPPPRSRYDHAGDREGCDALQFSWC